MSENNAQVWSRSQRGCHLLRGTKELGNQLEANCILIVKEADIAYREFYFKGSIFSGRNVELAGNAEVKFALCTTGGRGYG